jgi:esterase/lipase superfamily enzyme
MATLELTIQALSEEQAIELLKRFLRAVRALPPSQRSIVDRAQLIGTALSLSQSDLPRPSPGQLARSALLALATDARYNEGIAALLSATSERSFARPTSPLDAAEVLDVLDILEIHPAAADRAADEASAPGASAGQRGLARSLATQLWAYVGWGQAGPRTDAEYRVWYATTRRPLDPRNPAAGFGVERDETVHYGSCRVFVPRSHKIGSVGSPWWKRLVTITDDRLQLLAIEQASHEIFWGGVRQHLASCPDEDRDAVVFVHGFNVSFEDAALRAAQLGFDLQVKGAMALYSWASRGDVKMYLADAAAVELDEHLIADYLCGFALNTGAKRVHLIAHSMGNRAVLSAVDRIASDAERRTSVRFGQVVLAAADVDARRFQQLCAAYRTLAERTTLYVSTRDMAVEASRWLHDFPRAGLMPPVTVAEGIDTVNAVNADVSLLGHGYVAEARDVVSDIHALIRNGSRPQQRFGLRLVETEQGRPYWVIGA